MAENTTFNRMRLFLFVFKFLPRTVEFYTREGTCVYTQRVLDSRFAAGNGVCSGVKRELLLLNCFISLEQA